ncbi:MAG: DUF4417 domain-containing protein [Victivallales bacterium]|nr:DUF4417 domain-containing protein [Victivallales bacterium]
MKMHLSDVHEIPVINPLKVELPCRMVPFSVSMSRKWKDFNCWVCFYEKDSAFECLWRNPQRYLSSLRKFKGVISPDFSISLTSPWSEQFLQFARGRMVAGWLQSNGIPVIGNVRTVRGFTTKINAEKQMKHIPGSPYFMPGRSIFLGTMEDAQKLINEFAGTGEWIEPNRERIHFSRVIGKYVNYLNEKQTETTIGILHYSQSGTHIVPANPQGEEK